MENGGRRLISDRGMKMIFADARDKIREAIKINSTRQFIIARETLINIYESVVVALAKLKLKG